MSSGIQTKFEKFNARFKKRIGDGIKKAISLRQNTFLNNHNEQKKADDFSHFLKV
jgi:hypothetical protein